MPNYKDLHRVPLESGNANSHPTIIVHIQQHIQHPIQQHIQHQTNIKRQRTRARQTASDLASLDAILLFIKEASKEAPIPNKH